jgi:hypothetical protein
MFSIRSAVQRHPSTRADDQRCAAQPSAIASLSAVRASGVSFPQSRRRLTPIVERPRAGNDSRNEKWLDLADGCLTYFGRR